MLKIRNIPYTNGGAYHINLTWEVGKIPYIMQKGMIKIIIEILPARRVLANIAPEDNNNDTAVVAKTTIKIVDIWI
jgi:hypothetical protein